MQSSYCKPRSKFSWSLSVNHACNSRNPTSHQGNTEGSHKGHSLPSTTCFLQNHSPSCRHNDFLRFLKNRIGYPPKFNPDNGKMVKKEASSHMNFLELKATFLAFQVLVPSVKGAHICFGIDNCTAMYHINKLGGTQSQKLSNLAIELWNYALNRKLIISPIHIPGKLNVLADQKSRIFKDSIEWILNPRIFRRW